MQRPSGHREEGSRPNKEEEKSKEKDETWRTWSGSVAEERVGRLRRVEPRTSREGIAR